MVHAVAVPELFDLAILIGSRSAGRDRAPLPHPSGSRDRVVTIRQVGFSPIFEHVAMILIASIAIWVIAHIAFRLTPTGEGVAVIAVALAVQPRDHSF